MRHTISLLCCHHLAGSELAPSVTRWQSANSKDTDNSASLPSSWWKFSRLGLKMGRRQRCILYLQTIIFFTVPKFSRNFFFLQLIYRFALSYERLSWWYSIKTLAVNEGDAEVRFPGLGRSPGEGNGNPLQYSCLGNPMDRSLTGYSPRGCKEQDTTEGLNNYYIKNILCIQCIL